MKQTPKVTVITVTYNCKDTIEKTIRNVLKQTYPHVEYIIIDGNSTDGTKEIIERYCDRLAYYISEPDHGIYDAMNKGIKVATGEWIIFRNSGDYFFKPSTIEDVFKWYRDKGEALITGGTRFFEHNGYFDSYYSPASNHPCDMACFSHPSTFVRCRIQKKNLFPEALKIAGDFSFFCRLMIAGCSYSCYPHIISLFDNGAGTSFDNRKRSYLEKVWVAENLNVDAQKIAELRKDYIHVCFLYRPLKIIKKFKLTNWLYRKILYRNWKFESMSQILSDI